MTTAKKANSFHLFSDEIVKKLREPIPEEAISELPGTSGKLSTIDSMYIIERLNNVFGMGRWSIEHETVTDNDTECIVCGYLSITEYGFKSMSQYGGSNKMMGSKRKNAGYAHKGAVTDLLSKLASLLEIGIDVFKGQQTHQNPAPPVKKLTAGEKKGLAERIKEVTLEAAKGDESICLNVLSTTTKGKFSTWNDIEKLNNEKRYGDLQIAMVTKIEEIIKNIPPPTTKQTDTKKEEDDLPF